MSTPAETNLPAHGEPAQLPIAMLTGKSIWVITPDRHQRVPRCKYAHRPANNTPSVENDLEDRVWHNHHGATWEEIGGEFGIRITPDVGPTDGFGIITGIIELALGRG